MEDLSSARRKQMRSFNKKIAFVALLIVLCSAFMLTSCIGSTTTSNKEAETTAASPSVAPSEISEDPGSDALSFTMNENKGDAYYGSVTTCEYTKGDVSYIASYNYKNGDDKAAEYIEIYLFGGETVSDVIKYASNAKYDASLDELVMLDGGFFIKGYKEDEVTLISRASDNDAEEAESDEATENADEADATSDAEAADNTEDTENTNDEEASEDAETTNQD